MRSGLSEAAATERLRSEGYNDLPTVKRRGFLDIAAEVLREPMFLLLVACGAISGLLTWAKARAYLLEVPVCDA